MSVYQLLTTGDASPKLVKSDRAGRGYLSAIQYLLPWEYGGGPNLCPFADECHDPCIVFAGRGQTTGVWNARQRRTDLYNNDRRAYLFGLFEDVERFGRHCDKRGMIPAVRLNGTSDIAWESIAPGLFTEFPDVQWYDYTKVPARMFRYLAGSMPPNYHLTFSRGSSNTDVSRRVLRAGGNVAVVFRTRAEFPKYYLGSPVFDGDDTDLRFLDPARHVIALYAKGRARSDCSGFVVDSPDHMVRWRLVGF